MMLSVVQEEYGAAPEQVLGLDRVHMPALGEEDVLVCVRAASVDRGTWHVMAGLPYPIRVAGFGVRRPKYPNPGRSFAGVVEAVGAGVTGLEEGAEGYGIADASFAEYVRARADKLAPKPAKLSFEQAAAVPVSGLAALQAVRDHGNVTTGDSVLIVGASGGVGMFAVQIAKSFGAEVTGVCSTAKVDAVRAIGADRVIDYTKEDFTRSGQRYDLILDMGGNRALSRVRSALTPRGTLVLVGGEGGDRWIGIGRSLQALLMSRFVSHKLRPLSAKPNQADLQVLKQLIETGKLTPV